MEKGREGMEGVGGRERGGGREKESGGRDGGTGRERCSASLCRVTLLTLSFHVDKINRPLDLSTATRHREPVESLKTKNTQLAVLDFIFET